MQSEAWGETHNGTNNLLLTVGNINLRYNLGHLWPRLEDEGLDVDSIILLEDEEEELAEVCSQNVQDAIALKWLIQTVKMAKEI